MSDGATRGARSEAARRSDGQVDPVRAAVVVVLFVVGVIVLLGWVSRATPR